MNEGSTKKINVMFMQSQSYFGSDSMIHSLIMKNLDRSRFTVHVACNRGSRHEKSPALQALENVPELQVRPTDFGPSLNAQSAKDVARQVVVDGIPGVAGLTGLARYARRNKIDIIHGTEKPRDAMYGLMIARLCGAAAVTHLHVGVEDWISPMTRRSMKHDAGLIGVSEFVANTAIAKGYDAAKTSWVLNAIDASKWDPTTDGSAVRTEFGLTTDVPVISIISRLFPWKGHGQLLEALAKVNAAGQPFKLMVVGEDDPRATPGGGSYLDQIKAQTATLGLNDKVIFTGFRTDIAQLHAASDIFAMPSFEEPCAVAFLEAMAMAKPVIALRSGGTPQLVDHGEAGLLSTPDDIDELAGNLTRLLADGELRRTMGAYGRRRVEDYFTPQRLADDVGQVYDGILAQS